MYDVKNVLSYQASVLLNPEMNFVKENEKWEEYENLL